MPATRARPAVKTKAFGYENFQGLDTSRDITALDIGRGQPLARLNNAYCDMRGQIVRDASAARIAGQGDVRHVSFYTPTSVVWVEKTGAGLDIVSEGGARIENAYPFGSAVTSVVFNGATHYFSPGQPAYIFSGEEFTQNLSPDLNLNLRPGFATAVDRRLAIAGMPTRPTEVQLSRVDNAEVFADDENPNSENVLRAGKIDVKNQLGTADIITGIASFENKRLAIFAQDRILIYSVGENIDTWQIDDTANIYIGTNSHKSIVNAGSDLLFCSRAGIHSLRRSAQNGITASTFPLSAQIEELYLDLYGSVENPQDIEAVWDQDRGQYHVFFPIRTTGRSTRLTLNIKDSANGEIMTKYSTGDFLRATCGASLGGTLVFGSEGGVYRILKKGQTEFGEHTVLTPKVTIEFPFFWHGNTEDYKQTKSIILQASGKGQAIVTGIDDEGRTFGSTTFEVDNDEDDNQYFGVPLSRQYERKWEHRYRAARYIIEVNGGNGLFRITGFAIKTREP